VTIEHQLGFRYAAGSDVGIVRSRNEDSAFASPRLFAVADGMGGHPHGDVASAVVTAVLAELDERLRVAKPGEVDPPAELAALVAAALRRLTEFAERDPDLTSMGSTLTALLWDGTDAWLAHVGDSRGYLLRDGILHQITRDHTLVQSLVDEGRITPDEAAAHPRKSMVMRALQTGGSAEPDVAAQQVAAGDRLLLCSDGLTDVVGPDVIRDVLGTAVTPEDAVRQLTDEAKRSKSPDNITCVVADVAAGRAGGDVMVVGAAADQPGLVQRPTPGLLARWTRRLRTG
jgi:PPM family protein phosphatase